MEGSITSGDYVIMDNDKLVGKNCLTFVHNTEHGAVIYKFYNIFVQSIESSSIRSKIRSYLTDWLYNPDEQLRNSINDSLEITFNISSNAVTKEYIHGYLSYLTELLPPELVYYNPINNLLVIDLDNEIALFSYFSLLVS